LIEILPALDLLSIFMHFKIVKKNEERAMAKPGTKKKVSDAKKKKTRKNRS